MILAKLKSDSQIIYLNALTFPYIEKNCHDLPREYITQFTVDFICNDLKVVMVQIAWIGIRRAIAIIIDSIVIAAVVR